MSWLEDTIGYATGGTIFIVIGGILLSIFGALLGFILWNIIWVMYKRSLKRKREEEALREHQMFVIQKYNAGIPLDVNEQYVFDQMNQVDSGNSRIALSDNENDATHVTIKFNVDLTSIGDNESKVIMAIREVTGLGLEDAKTLIKAMPSTIVESVTMNEANSIVARFNNAGAKTTLRQI